LQHTPYCKLCMHCRALYVGVSQEHRLHTAVPHCTKRSTWPAICSLDHNKTSRNSLRQLQSWLSDWSGLSTSAGSSHVARIRVARPRLRGAVRHAAAPAGASMCPSAIAEGCAGPWPQRSSGVQIRPRSSRAGSCWRQRHGQRQATMAGGYGRHQKAEGHQVYHDYWGWPYCDWSGGQDSSRPCTVPQDPS
jgi:hypothetical protein